MSPIASPVIQSPVPNSRQVHEDARAVFRVCPSGHGVWVLEKVGGEVGGIFTSKHAALAFACAEAEICRNCSVLIEISERPANDRAEPTDE
jgi:hypothetical protein